MFCYLLSFILGASDGTPGISTDGIIGRVLLIILEVIAVLAWVVSVVLFASMLRTQENPGPTPSKYVSV